MEVLDLGRGRHSLSALVIYCVIIYEELYSSDFVIYNAGNIVNLSHNIAILIIVFIKSDLEALRGWAKLYFSCSYNCILHVTIIHKIAIILSLCTLSCHIFKLYLCKRFSTSYSKCRA